MQVWEGQRPPIRFYSNKTTPRQIIMKLSRITREKSILKTEKSSISFKGVPLKLAVDLSVGTLQTGQKGYNTFKVLKEKKYANQGYLIQKTAS